MMIRDYIQRMNKNIKRYRKKNNQVIAAVQFNLETEGFTYKKWGSSQICKQGDWLVYNNGDTYSVDKETFSKTYRKESTGRYIKITPIWAEKTEKSGSIVTKEGISNYLIGDYLVYNNEDETDAYCISAESFHLMYELDN